MYKNNKYTEMCVKISIYKHENKQIYRNTCRKIFKEYIKNRNYKNM